MSTVFVVQEVNGKNILGAERWGRLRVILGSGQSLTFRPEKTIEHISSEMEDFSEDDYILAIGDPAAIGVVSALAAARCNGVIRMLKWDRQERVYYPVKLIIPQLRTQIQKGDLNNVSKQNTIACKESGRQSAG